VIVTLFDAEQEVVAVNLVTQVAPLLHPQPCYLPSLLPSLPLSLPVPALPQSVHDKDTLNTCHDCIWTKDHGPEHMNPYLSCPGHLGSGNQEGRQPNSNHLLAARRMMGAARAMTHVLGHRLHEPRDQGAGKD